MNQFSRRAFAFALASVASCVSVANAADDRPNFQMPFACDQQWRANTWDKHYPANSVDMTRSNGDSDKAAVVASYAGTVVTSRYATDTGYGHYVVIDHGKGWKTLYAHMKEHSMVKVGDKVAAGQKIGRVGNSSAKYDLATHLHYEQIHNGAVQKAVWNRVALKYFEKRNYTSKNSCGSRVAASAAPRIEGTIRTNGAPLNVRSGPNTASSVIGRLANGDRVSIRCQKSGETIRGTFGTSDLWSNVGPHGSNRYVPDAFILTGASGQTVPTCP